LIDEDIDTGMLRFFGKHMPAKPFRIIETPPEPPSADELARTHHLSRREKATIAKFAISVRASKGTGKSASVARFGSKTVAARKK
jgi:hypothetical protein